ncbi:YhjD/YihY/BrkB family envelope integrity protein [Cerasicoccus fimbriatus]|uniref:YhjD/YihY/BrkB family envelope integrity protein n=1 Tax=Cerasicoccus fimbriatus TaxID=3014554 RepID=UPI0022B33575|nr:YhjD/YihY/BrkB family envelope integrity protein [Cerasicoccus sp. TK19100]
MDSDKSKSQPWWRRAQDEVNALPGLVRDEIWHTGHLEDSSNKAKFFAFLRVFALTWDGILNNRIPSQAAALSYYTLIALGPLIAIGIMISGFVMPDGGRDKIADKITEAVYFVVPSANQAGDTNVITVPEDDAKPGEVAEGETLEKQEAEDDIEAVIDYLVDNSRSSTIGILGSVMLIFISIQLLSTIEKTFNSIWGVKQGRSLIQQFVFYWAIISLGAVVAVALTFGLYGKIASTFDSLPLGNLFQESFLALTPVFIFILTVLLLTLFIRFMPNATVNWKPAILGALVVAGLLYLNQSVGFLYIGFVVRQKSLFGAVGILPVLLFGLFIFWLFLLLGGQVTYAIQNANRLTHQRAWENNSRRTRELLAIAVYTIIARRFENCEPPLSVDELSERIRVPINTLNHTISDLIEVGLLSVVEPDSQHDTVRYQPGRPVDSVTLSAFKDRLELKGNNEALRLLIDADPIVQQYQDLLLDMADDHPGRVSLKELISDSGKPRAADRQVS